MFFVLLQVFMFQVAIHVGRKISAPSFPTPIENAPVRSTLQDARGSFQLGYDSGCEKQDDGSEKLKLKRQLSSDDISLRNLGSNMNKENIIKDLVDGEMTKRMSFADLGKQKVLGESKGIHLVYMNDKEEYPSKSSFLNKLGSTNGSSEKKTTFAMLPNTTTWQQQSTNQQHVENNGDATNTGSNVMNVQLNDIRMKLEEKRRHIESEKRRMEMAMNKQRQKVGQAAFLQAVAKVSSMVHSNTLYKVILHHCIMHLWLLMCYFHFFRSPISFTLLCSIFVITECSF